MVYHHHDSEFVMFCRFLIGPLVIFNWFRALITWGLGVKWDIEWCQSTYTGLHGPEPRSSYSRGRVEFLFIYTHIYSRQVIKLSVFPTYLLFPYITIEWNGHPRARPSRGITSPYTLHHARYSLSSTTLPALSLSHFPHISLHVPNDDLAR